MRRSPAIWTVVPLAAVAAAGLVYLAARALRDPARGIRGAILVSIDTLRADHLGCYGYGPPTSPEIDAFRRDAILFASAIAHAPSTLPSHASLFTSLLPDHHGASFAGRTALPEELDTLAEVLSRRGIETASFNNGGQVDGVFGLAQGFAVYESLEDHRFDAVVDAAIRRLGTASRDRFFLFLHTYEVHAPYTPDTRLLSLFDDAYRGPLPPEISQELIRRINGRALTLDEADLRHVAAAYDAEIRSADAAFGRLMRLLREQGLYDDTLVILTSDHGEEFGEHGWVGWHSHTLYDELLRVPLLVKLPGGAHAGDRVEAQVRLIDVAPTVVAAFRLRAPRQFQGESLLPLLEEAEPSSRVAVSRLDRTAPRRGPIGRSIRTARWKLANGHLYDLERDPQERTPVTTVNWDTVRELKDRLERELAAREVPSDVPVVDASRPPRHDLEALGYVN